MYFSSIAAEGSFLETYWMVFVLLAVIILLYVFSFVRRKKVTEQTKQMMDTLKPGVKVKTYSGFYGTIISIKETTDGKIVLLETGEGGKVSYTTIDANAIYGVDLKEDVVYDKDGNIVDMDAEKKTAQIAAPAVVSPVAGKKSDKEPKAKKELTAPAVIAEQPKAEEPKKDEPKKEAEPAVKKNKPKTTTSKKSTTNKKNAK